MRTYLVGTRSSRLSLAQTKVVTELLSRHVPGIKVEVVPVRTLGDRLPPEKRGSVDGKAAFTGEIDSMLAEGKVDLAVHSMKDLPSEMDERLVVAATPPRGDPRDALISRDGRALLDLPPHAKVGTGSLRRKAQMLRIRDDLVVADISGNVETRMGRLDDGLDAVVLAAAGLERIGASGRVAQYFSRDEMVPAVGQGTLAVQARKDDTDLSRLLSSIDDPRARTESACERAFSQRLGGDCYVPVGANAELSGASLSAVGMVASPDGSEVLKATVRGDATEAASLGRSLADELLESGGERILERMRP